MKINQNMCFVHSTPIDLHKTGIILDNSGIIFDDN